MQTSRAHSHFTYPTLIVSSCIAKREAILSRSASMDDDSDDEMSVSPDNLVVTTPERTVTLS